MRRRLTYDRSNYEDQSLDIRSPLMCQVSTEEHLQFQSLEEWDKVRKASVSSGFSQSLCLNEQKEKWLRKATNINLMPPVHVTTSVLTHTPKCTHNHTYITYIGKKWKKFRTLIQSKTVFIHYFQDEICLRWNSSDQITQYNLSTNHRHPVQKYFSNDKDNLKD